MLDTSDRPTIGEQYDRASNATSLAVDADHRKPVDVLIASGWSPATLGGAIMRMHSEYSRPPKNAGRTDAILAFGQLKTMPAVVEQVHIRALVWRIEEAHEKARAVVAWWLDQVCPCCNGHGKMVVPGTPYLSNRLCPRPEKGGCGGTGKRALPHGGDGRRLATYMDSCVSDWHGSMKKNLAQHRRARNKVQETPAGRVIVTAKE